MVITKIKTKKSKSLYSHKLAESVWKAGFTYIRTVVDNVHQPFVILDLELRVIAVNETFYRFFQTLVKDTEKKLLFKLGDGEWNIPKLKILLDDILTKDTFFTGFEVRHIFEKIGLKVMLLNARKIYINHNKDYLPKKPMILLAIEDITEITTIAEKLVGKTKEYEDKMIERTDILEMRIAELAYLNKTVLGFDKTISELTLVIESLKK